MHLAWFGLEKVRIAPELISILSEPSIAQLTEYPISEGAAQRARADADWVATEADQDFPLLHGHCSVSLWSILEVFVEDLAVAWFLNRKEAWEIELLEKIRVSIGTYERLQGENRARHVVGEIYRHLGADLKTGGGSLNAVLAALPEPCAAGGRQCEKGASRAMSGQKRDRAPRLAVRSKTD